MFRYAEAKYNLGDLAEAEKAYKIIEKYFPKSKIAVTIKERLEDIKNRKTKADTSNVK
jgi:TolA-binding protein